mmetsp:Transcript_3075/g.4552  ORF Transcript_3075/g.4552 Transcript_3075/m.4552 type:complete len:487 (-) Transcript_3075:280-1740(-)|eukprot:CAMPEP_0194224720 /NCGR_PEP_ID=MMETSP0156-20130528/38019_1 /TAXON_ID=33649 /ORGANISM="Thalassionema nitzschioides, Strain L26-B" /LENGTH=486 /DNA_ID=CAMNT_0038956403 /DNA_START=24 /DNA_END=1484 /DNA_ORIENTATION=+
MLLKYYHLPITLLLFGRSLVDALGSSTVTNKPLNWLIVGGGPHGVHIATRLLDEVRVSNLQIVDDGPQLLHKWKSRTAATGMSYLRSSASFHLDVREDGLKRFSEQRGVRSGSRKSKKSNLDPNLFASDYQRPKLDFFNEHCDHVIAKNNLDDCHVQGIVTDIIPKEDYVEVDIRRPNGEIVTSCAENIVLALGSDGPSYPDWATEDMITTGRVRHIFDESNGGVTSSDEKDCCSIAIVGGGISAAHFALKLEREASTADNGLGRKSTIHMICRHELREKQFDTHQDWMMDSFAAKRSKAGGGQGIPKCQRHFSTLNSLIERRNVINRERQAGTISPSVIRGEGGLRYALEEERIHWHKGDIQSVVEDNSSSSGGRLSISTFAGEDIVVDQIVLATGFGKRPPCANLINSIAERNGLELYAGYPAPDESLRWHKMIFVAGALAELELGPSSRNIAGARLASERIIAAAARMSGNSVLGNHVASLQN